MIDIRSLFSPMLFLLIKLCLVDISPLCTLSIFLSKIQRQGKACMPEISSPIFLPWCTRSFFRQLQYSDAEKLPEILLSFSLVQENHSSCCYLYLYLGTIQISFFNSLLVWNCFLYSSDDTETSGLSFLCPTLIVQHPQMETSPIGKLAMIPAVLGQQLLKPPFQ